MKRAQIDFSRDQLVFGGDMINRGRDSAKVVRTIKQLSDNYPEKVQVLMGNHEEMMRDYYQSGDKFWLSHGHETLRDFEKTFSKAELNAYIEWISNLPLLYEDEDYVFTHAGLNPSEPLDQQGRDILWISELEFYSIPKETLLSLTQSKPVIHGHTPVEIIHFDGARLNGDLGSNTYSVIEERGPALVNLDLMVYYVYKQATGKIEERSVIRF